MIKSLEKYSEKRQTPVVLPELCKTSSPYQGNNIVSVFSEHSKKKGLADWLALGGFFGGTGSALAWTMQNESHNTKVWQLVKLHNDIRSEKPMFKDICLGRMRKAPPSKKLLIATALGITALVAGMIIKNSENKSVIKT